MEFLSHWPGVTFLGRDPWDWKGKVSWINKGTHGTSVSLGVPLFGDLEEKRGRSHFSSGIVTEENSPVT